MKHTLDPQGLARVALTSLRLAHIHQSLFSEALPDLRWQPVDETSTAKAASKLSAHVEKLFPICEIWEEDFDAAESFSQEIPVVFYGWTMDEISDMGGSHEWTDLEVYLYGLDGYLDDSGECEESLAEIYEIHDPAEIGKIFLKLEAMLVADDERLREHKLMWRNMARRLRWLTSNTGHQFLDRDNETHGYSGQVIPWEQDWVDGLTEQWRAARPYMESTGVFWNWVKESQDNTNKAVAVIRLVCETVAADGLLAGASRSDAQNGEASENGDSVDILAAQQLLDEMIEDEYGKENDETT